MEINVNSQEISTGLRGFLEESGSLGKEAPFIEWRSKASALLRMGFGAQSEQVLEFQAATTVKNEGYTTAHGRNRDLELWRQDAVSRGKAALSSAIYILDMQSGDSYLDDVSIDPELWVHVQGLISSEDWSKVPAAVAIFVEDKVRRWAGDPKNANNTSMIGKVLYVTVLGNSGTLRLGRQDSEVEGWRSLGTGLAQAIGNVDRHRIQQRADIRRYAMGVLGLGSLLLTQIRYENPASVAEAEAAAEASGTMGLES
jgi:hypothetical protein